MFSLCCNYYLSLTSLLLSVTYTGTIDPGFPGQKGEESLDTQEHLDNQA